MTEGKEGGYKLIRLWVHEVYRVFYDRLVDEEDRATFYGIIKVCDFHKIIVKKMVSMRK